MKLSILLIVLCILPLVAASIQTDTLNADFNLGNTSQVNVTNDTVILASVNSTFNLSATFTSRVFDLGSNPANTTISWNFNTPANTSLLVATRSGANATNFTNWSGWSGFYGFSAGSAVVSPLNRYYQYEAQLATTDNTTTPELDDVTLSYNETGPSVNSTAANLTTNTSAPYTYTVNISDTLPLTNLSASYRLGNSSFTNTTVTPSAGLYSIVIPGGWSTYLLQNLTVQLNVTDENSTSNNTYSFNLTKLIDDTPPVIDPIANYSALQNSTLNVTVTGSDFDNQSINYTTNQTGVSVTKLTNTSSKLSWSPNASQSGAWTIKVYASDGRYNSSRTFTVFVTDVNYPPTIDSVSAISSYHGVPQSLTLTGYDPDLGENITFSISPEFFQIQTTDSIGNVSSPGTFYGIANYTPADPEDGVHNITFFISDGTLGANTTTTMTMNYCGDNVCQSTYENATSCPSDCAQTTALDQIALIIPDRNCVNQSSTVYTFNATNRYSCYYEGLVEQGLALCDGIDGVSVDVYYKDGFQLTQMTTLNSGENGSAKFIPDQVGEYKLVATKEGYSNTSAIVTVRDCNSSIVVQQTNTTVYQPTPPTNKPTTPPQQQLPELTPQQTNWFGVFIFYCLVPLLLAALIYTSSVFYDVNKDTLPWLLELRITLYQQRMRYDPQIKQLQTELKPILEPVAQSIVALYNATLKPLIAKFRRPKQ